jgi:hypothetical protein
MLGRRRLGAWIGWGAITLVAVVGCGEDKAAPPAEEAEVRGDTHCNVVEQGGGELEEGFGAFFDITDEGYSDADEDAEHVYIRTERGKLEVNLGHHGYSQADGDIIKRLPRAPGAKYQDTYVETSSIHEKYVVRLFDNKLGLVFYTEAGGKDGSVIGTLDCREVVEREAIERDIAKIRGCDVVKIEPLDIEGTSFEKDLGSIYAIDDTGRFIDDRATTRVEIEPDGEKRIALGKRVFEEARGDAITVENVDEFLTYTIRPRGSQETILVRLFRDVNDEALLGVGAILVKKTPTSKYTNMAAVLDCRGGEPPAPLK